MWTINPSPKTNSFSSQRSLKLFGLSDLNVPALFFTASPSLTKGDNKPGPTRPSIVKNPNPVLPIAADPAFLYKIEGNWTTTGLTKVNSINQLDVGKYLWLNGFTYVISDLTTRTFKSTVSFTITDPVNLGYFEQDVTKVTAGGLTLDFTQIDGNVVITTNSKSCIGRIGQTAEIWFERELNPNEFDKNPILFFSKVGTGVGVATLFDYLGYNYLVSTTLEDFTLVNTTNNRFFIVRETQIYEAIPEWLLSGGLWNDDSSWNDSNIWED